jgi:hypothetical protein
MNLDPQRMTAVYETRGGRLILVARFIDLPRLLPNHYFVKSKVFVLGYWAIPK